MFVFFPSLSPSARGELEITDMNNWFVEQGTMEYGVAEGFWGDAGKSIDEFYEVNDFVHRNGAKKRSRGFAGFRCGASRTSVAGSRRSTGGAGCEKAMKQTNVSFSKKGVIRGLHSSERGEGGLFVCLRGTARVVVLDLGDGRDVHRGHRRRESGRDLRARPLATASKPLPTSSSATT